MNCQSIARNQRPRGFKLKQVLKLALLLAVVVWLVYQTKQSLHESKGYAKTVNVKLDEDHGSVILGRKGLIDESLSGSENVDFAVGEGDLDVKAKELSHEESDENVRYHNDIGVQGKDNASNSIEELPREDYTGKGQDYLRASKPDHDEHGDEIDQEQMKMPPNGIENGTDSDQQALLDGVHGFNDENGVPELGSNNLISVLIGARDDDREKIVLQETILTSDNRSSTGNVNSLGIDRLSEATKEED